MPSYFEPLQRKIGVVTLLTAFVFMGTWLRSRTTADDVALATPWGLPTRLISDYRGLWLVQHESWSGPKPTRLLWHESSDTASNPSDSQLSNSFLWHSIGVYYDRNEEQQVLYLQASHWSVVIPLTLFSAWLLLSKTRIRTEPPIPSASENP